MFNSPRKEEILAQSVLVCQALRLAATRHRRHAELSARSMHQLVDAKGNGRQDDEEDDDDDGNDVVALCHGDGSRSPAWGSRVLLYGFCFAVKVCL